MPSRRWFTPRQRPQQGDEEQDHGQAADGGADHQRRGDALTRRSRLICTTKLPNAFEIIGFAPPQSDAVWVLAPWRQDPHPDPAAVGQAAAIACDAYSARPLEYPLTGWRPDAPPLLRTTPASCRSLRSCTPAKRHALAAMLHPDRVEAVAVHELYLG